MTQTLSQFLTSGRIIVHLGAHKTASTFIHQCIEDQRHDLKERGTHVLLPSDLRGQDTLLRPSWGTGWIEETRKRLTQRLEADVSASGANAMLICEENIIGSPRKVLKTGVLYADFAKRIDVLPRAFDHPNVTFLFAIRDYGTFFSSCVTTAMRRGALFDFEALRRSLDQLPRRWGHLIGELTTAFPSAHVKLWRYEDFNEMEERVFNCFDACPVDAAGKTAMQTLSQAAVEHLMSAHATRAKIPQPRQKTRAAQLQFPVSPDHPPFRLWDMADAARISALYDEDFQDIAEALPDAVLRP